MQSVALMALAAVGAMAVPAQAQDADQQERQEARAAMREARQEQRAERQEQRPERQQAPQQQQEQQQQQRVERQMEAPPQAEARGGERNWNRGGDDGGAARTGWQARAEARQQAQAQQPQPQQRTAPDGGWRSQRAPDGQRYGRNRDNGMNGGDAVSRPAPAWRGAAPQTPDRGVTDQARAERWGAQGAERNRTYSDPNRSGSYRGDRERTAESWRDRKGDRNGSNTYRNGYRDGRSADNYRDWHDQNHERNRYASGSKDHRRWDRNNWRRDTRYNWSGYRNQHRDLYSAGRYYSPYNNYSYSRLSIGFFLNRGFYGQNYWINDPYQYRLPEVYGPYRWVRYYDDVLLVDIYSGEVVDVIHNFFW